MEPLNPSHCFCPAIIPSAVNTVVLVIATIPLLLTQASTVMNTSMSTVEVAQLAVNFFRRRRIKSVVVYVCGDAGRRHILRTFATSGDFETVAPVMPLNHTSFVLRTVGILMWSDCPWASGILQSMSNEFSTGVHWLIVNDDGFNPEDANLRLDTELTIATINQNNSWIELWEVFRANPDDDNVIKPVAVCTTALLCEVNDYDTWQSAAVRRQGVQNVRLRGVLHMWKVWGPEVMYRLHEMSRDEAVQLTIITPMAMHGHILFMNCVARYNMTVTDLISSDGPGQLVIQPGVPFNGAVGVVERGEGDVVSGLVTAPDRHRVMAFSPTTWKLKTVCGFLSNNALGALDALAKPFHWSAWAGIVFLGILVLALHKYFRAVDGTEEVTWSDIFISSFGTFTGQGFLGCGDSISCRCLMFVFEIFFYLSQAFYSAAIVIFLLRPPPSSIRSVHDLVESKYKGVAHNWIHTIRMIQNSTDPLVRDVFLKKIQQPNGLGFVPTNEGLMSLMVPWTAFFASDDYLYEAASKLTDKDVCRFVEFDVDVPLFVSVATAKHAPFKEWMPLAMTLQVERGIAVREQRVWHFQRPTCVGGGGAEDQSVGFTPILPALTVLLCGVLVALVFLAVELHVGCWKIEEEEEAADAWWSTHWAETSRNPGRVSKLRHSGWASVRVYGPSATAFGSRQIS